MHRGAARSRGKNDETGKSSTMDPIPSKGKVRVKRGALPQRLYLSTHFSLPYARVSYVLRGST